MRLEVGFQQRTVPISVGLGFMYLGSSTLQKQAIDDATATFGNLPRENPVFKQCDAAKSD